MILFRDDSGKPPNLYGKLVKVNLGVVNRGDELDKLNPLAMEDFRANFKSIVFMLSYNYNYKILLID